MRHGAERLELCLEQRLVDLALVDRNALLDTEADHFLPVDPELLGELVRREVVCHDAPVLEQQKSPAALRAGEGMSSAAVVGHSLGGTIALRLAVVRPELVSALVLAAPAGITSSTSTAANVITMLVISRPGRAVSPFRRVIAARKPLRYPAFWWWQVSDPAALSPRAVEGFLEGPGLHQDIATAGRALIGHDPRPYLDAVLCPVLVLWGARDRLVPLADGFDF